MDWWSKGRISGEYRDPMNGKLLPGSVKVYNSHRLTTTNGIIIPILPMYHRVLSVGEDLSFDFEVYTTDDTHINQDFHWIVVVETATTVDRYQITLTEDEHVRISDLEPV